MIERLHVEFKKAHIQKPTLNVSRKNFESFVNDYTQLYCNQVIGHKELYLKTPEAGEIKALQESYWEDKKTSTQLEAEIDEMIKD